MNVLLACEYSNIGSQAFRDRGHTVYSVDLEPNEQPELSNGYHYQGDIFEFWKDRPCEFDLMIGHPPCTYMTNAASGWLYKYDEETDGKIKDEERWKNMREGAEFFNRLWALPVKRKCFENPVMVGHAKKLLTAGKQSQVVQPWMFGVLESKGLCLWLDNLDPLKQTNNVKEEMLKLPKNIRERSHYTSPGPNRWKERSRSFAPIMQAMAAQWG